MCCVVDDVYVYIALRDSESSLFQLYIIHQNYYQWFVKVLSECWMLRDALNFDTLRTETYKSIYF